MQRLINDNLKKPFMRLLTLLTLSLLFFSVGCASKAFDKLNPLIESGNDAGERNNKAILSGGKITEEETARNSLEVMNSYRKTQEPQPYLPVVQPAEVRLMWVPDHTNKAGDLVPSHYYYLKVLNDRWMVQDSFDLERQLEGGNSYNSKRTPYVVKGTK